MSENGHINFMQRANKRPLDKAEFEANAELAESAFLQKMDEDPAFAAAVKQVAAFYKPWVAVAGHRHLSQHFVKFADR